MKARVIRAYKDRVDGSVHYPNTRVELTAERLGELAGKGFVEAEAPETSDGAPEPEAETEAPGTADGAPGPDAPAGDAPDVEAMTAAQLRALIAERGGSAPKRATKAQLLEIAGAL